MAVLYSNAFKRQLKRLARKYRRIRSDVEPVIDQLDAGERPGDQIQEIGYRVYKVRVKNTDARRGKRGGYRLLYYLQTADDVLLVTIYSKSDQSDIDDAELAAIVIEVAKVKPYKRRRLEVLARERRDLLDALERTGLIAAHQCWNRRQPGPPAETRQLQPRFAASSDTLWLKATVAP